MFLNVREKKLKIQDMQMDYITFGNGSQHLIMIHGLSTRGIKGMGRPLAYMYRNFAKDYQVHLFDRRDDIREGITVRDLAKDLAAAMDSLGIIDAHVIGVSQGGMIAQYLAIDRPDLVSKLVLVVTLSKNNDTVISVIGNWIQWARENDIKSLVADMSYKMYSEKYINRFKFLLPLLNVLMKPKDMRRFIFLAESCLTCNTYDELQKIQCPVFVIGGRNDQIVSGEASEEIAEKLNCKILIYEDLGHAVHYEAKDFNQRVYNFLIE